MKYLHNLYVAFDHLVSIVLAGYPEETKSSMASGNFNCGVTYPSAPSLSVTYGGVSVRNNSGNASCNVSKTLSGTVANSKSATLAQSFGVSFTGAI